MSTHVALRAGRYLRAASLVLAVAILAAGAANARGGGRPLRSPLAGKPFARNVDLLFATGGYAGGTIVRAHGGRVHQVSHLAYPVWNPIPSNDGKQIAFGAFTPGTRPTTIGLMRVDGAKARILPHTQNCYPGGWAPDNSWIVAGCGNFVPGSDVGLVELDLNGTVLRHLGSIPPGESASVSRTTGAIAFSDLDGSVYTVDPMTGAKVRIATDGSTPAWSPDGGTLAFFSQRGAGGDIETVSKDGSNLRVIKHIPVWPADFTLTYSANGRWIVYGGSSDRTHDLYMINSGGGGRVNRLTNIGIVGDPFWMPNPGA